GADRGCRAAPDLRRARRRRRRRRAAPLVRARARSGHESRPRVQGPDAMSDGDPRAILRPLLRTRQVRQYTDEPVADDAVAALVDVARWTGSSRNEQPWRFIVLRDLAAVRRIGE